MAGRKNRYEEYVKPYLEEINKKVREGVIESEIAKALGISIATLNNYKLKYPELRDALSKNKGADVLQKLVNAGIESACGYFKENETTTIVLGDDGQPSKRSKVITKTWYPPNATLNKFYVLNYGRDEGFVNDPIEAELKKAKLELDQMKYDSENWFNKPSDDGDDDDEK